MFLGAFQRLFKGLQKSSPNWSRPVHVNRFFAILQLKNKKTGLQVQSGYSLFPVTRPDFQTLFTVEVCSFILQYNPKSGHSVDVPWKVRCPHGQLLYHSIAS